MKVFLLVLIVTSVCFVKGQNYAMAYYVDPDVRAGVPITVEKLLQGKPQRIEENDMVKAIEQILREKKGFEKYGQVTALDLWMLIDIYKNGIKQYRLCMDACGHIQFNGHFYKTNRPLSIAIAKLLVIEIMDCTYD